MTKRWILNYIVHFRMWTLLPWPRRWVLTACWRSRRRRKHYLTPRSARSPSRTRFPRKRGSNLPHPPGVLLREVFECQRNVSQEASGDEKLNISWKQTLLFLDVVGYFSKFVFKPTRIYFRVFHLLYERLGFFLIKCLHIVFGLMNFHHCVLADRISPNELVEEGRRNES